MPLFFTRKEVFEWLKTGKKTIDIRKGKPHKGQIAVFQVGPKILRMKITKKETGSLTQVMRSDNFRLVIPSATVIDDVVAYLHVLYGTYDGVFTAYYLEL